MLDSFLTFINQQKLHLSGQRTLLTISGGVDSVVMASLFHKAGFSAGFAHCNFGLRGEDSDQDEVFVRELGEYYGFQVYTKLFDTKAFVKENAISTQMAARDLRYPWFEKIRKENSFDWIATAHHANDSLETTLLNLVRGTGIAGLHGIAVQNNFLIRPLLFATKDEILDYARQNNLSWREDRSNQSLDYKRNVVRKRIVPVLKEMNPSLESTFLITSEKMRAAESLLTEFLENWQKDAVRQTDGQLHISISALLTSTEPAYRLWHILNNYGFRYSQVMQIAKSLRALSGKIFHSDSHMLLKDREDLILKPIERETITDSVIINKSEGDYSFADDCLHMSPEIKQPGLEIEKSKDIAYVDGDMLSFPLMVRQWLSGDIFCPFGMKGKRKKVSDVLIDLKLNIYQKEKISVLVNGNGEIIWVIGIRTDERYRITDQTQTMIRMEWIRKI
ncbi:tRNA lysidine(34) synthetase TilS [Dyadobacter sp. NIV53]|uniref:tRNA lysidine(34) synthetase TilS n=1 Tax=Dyadobacter sp. NIV53 TaxID=2861765 RepID=UPI001C879E0C|nr:tRNA lysidine(34) synthetase TilS [Dyadobacter sp. NIV53]